MRFIKLTLLVDDNKVPTWIEITNIQQMGINIHGGAWISLGSRSDIDVMETPEQIIEISGATVCTPIRKEDKK